MKVLIIFVFAALFCFCHVNSEICPPDESCSYDDTKQVCGVNLETGELKLWRNRCIYDLQSCRSDDSRRKFIYEYVLFFSLNELSIIISAYYEASLNVCQDLKLEVEA